MASDPVIDIQRLSAPIPDGPPVGPYWRDDKKCSGELYPRVDSAIRSARSNERRKAEVALFAEDSIERRNYEEPDWREVVDAAKSLLAQSKDLWVAAWLTESLARVHGFAGLRDGFLLIRNLCENYWDSVHPRPDEIDGIRNTLAQLDGDMLAELVTRMPVTSDGFTIADYDKSAEMDGLDSAADRDAYRALGVISTVEFEARIRDSGPEFLQQTIDDAQAASDAFDALTKLLDDRCGHDAPASSKVQENFRQSIDLIRELAGPFLPKLERPDPLEQANEVGSNDREQGGNPPGWNRDHAFQVISRQADLFEKYEPNSPVASILRQAVSVGKLPWREMIKGFLPKNDSALEQILKQTGVSHESALDEQEG